jgi:hypothetical protein
LLLEGVPPRASLLRNFMVRNSVLHAPFHSLSCFCTVLLTIHFGLLVK